MTAKFLGNTAGRRTFLKMKDNNGLDTMYRHIVRTPAVRSELQMYYAKTLDAGSIAQIRAVAAQQKQPQIVLKPFLGDPHQILLQYALKHGCIEKIDVDGQPIFETCLGDGDVQRIKIVDFTMVEFLAKQILNYLGKGDTPEDAKDYLDEMLIGGEELAASAGLPHVPWQETTHEDLNAWATYIEQPAVEELVIPTDPAALKEIKDWVRPRLIERK
eukprot:TRINITY_DN53712_c0_g1_i1.p2 TRINITY_DN53712_c0_g1~~TRINITY_DN53712_c0_g1_i1.p2  ORF type:complete len:241 (+),score=43.03 TRINITY_DN53712_c0_g1_i1:76-723(+)